VPSFIAANCASIDKLALVVAAAAVGAFSAGGQLAFDTAGISSRTITRFALLNNPIAAYTTGIDWVRHASFLHLL
jgi:hypothetical protein